MSFFGEMWQNIVVPIKSIGSDIGIVTGITKPADKPKTTETNTKTADPYTHSWFLRLSKAEWQRSEEWLLRKMQSMLSEGKLTKADYNSLIKRRNELLKGEKYTLWEGVADSIQSNIEAAGGKGLGAGSTSTLLPTVLPVLLIALIAMALVRFYTSTLKSILR